MDHDQGLQMLRDLMDRDPAPVRDSPETFSGVLDGAAKLKARLANAPPPRELTKEEIAAREAAIEAEEREGKRRQAWSILMPDLGRRYARERTRIDAFEVYHDEQRKVVRSVQVVASQLEEFVKLGCGLVLYGPVGTGKDHLLAWLLWEAAERGIVCRWINGLDFFGTIRDRMKEEQPERQVLNELLAPDVLGISDPIPPGRAPTDWNIEVLFRLVDRRYRACKSTWITMNVATTKEADELLSAQVFDRLRDGATVLPCFWPSYRGRKA